MKLTYEFKKSEVIWTDEEFGKIATDLSKKHNCYVIVNCFLKKVVFSLSNRKPSGSEAENTYNYYGGFFKSGSIVPPSPSFIRKYNKITVR